MRKQTKAEIEERANRVDLENSALRIYASAMRAAEHASAVHVNHASSPDYYEVWMLYRPLLASGGAVVIECRDAQTTDILSWDAMLLTEACRRFNEHHDPYRRESFHKIYRAHIEANMADPSPVVAE